jgi:hypothetical protein
MLGLFFVDPGSKHFRFPVRQSTIDQEQEECSPPELVDFQEFN